jgi:hypothetical protein
MVGSLATLPHSNSIGMRADLSARPQRVFRSALDPPTLTRGSISELRIQAIVFAGSLFFPDIRAPFLSIPRFRVAAEKRYRGGGGHAPDESSRHAFQNRPTGFWRYAKGQSRARILHPSRSSPAEVDRWRTKCESSRL